jgi:hypothetical protein
MPEPNRAPWLIAPDLSAAPIARLIEQGAEIGLLCHACRRRATWTAQDLRRRFAGRPGLTFRELAPRLRCGVCRSDWIEVGRGEVGRLSPASPPRAVPP